MSSLVSPRLSRIIFLNATLLVLLTTSSQLVAQEQLGRPFINNYSYQEYKAGAINWWAIEDDEGIMYFANGGGILQYDGVNWNKLDIDVGVRCFAKDDKGTIYVGSEGDIGYLTRNEIGELKYVSLADKIPEEHRSITTVWEVDYYKERIIFRTEYKLYCWDGENMKVISSEKAFHVGDIVNDVYYLRIWGVGLCTLKDDDTFELVPGGEQFADIRIYSILPYDDNNLLIGTRMDGFFLYDGNSFRTFKTEVDDFIKGNLYLPGAALEDGRFAFNTFSDGVYLIDHDGKLIQKYTTENGLQDGSVDFIYVDSRGVLWMMLFNGISNVNLNSTFTVLDSNMGLSTNVVFAVKKFNNMLYLNTNNGVFYIEDGSKEIQHIGTG